MAILTAGLAAVAGLAAINPSAGSPARIPAGIGEAGNDRHGETAKVAFQLFG